MVTSNQKQKGANAMSIKDTDRKARENYRKKVERLYLELYPTDEDIKAKLAEIAAQGIGKTTYIKELIRKDIEKQKG
jgi:predicted DNA binding CopG/RHH family protein